jgi:hypothetical protein
MRTRTGVVGSIIALALAMVPASARADWTTPDFFGQETLPAKFSTFYPHGTSHKKRSRHHRHKTPPKATRRQRAKLRFTADPALAASDAQQLVEPFVDSLGISAADAQTYVAGAVTADDQTLAAQGWRSDDLGDLVPYYFVQAYRAYYHLDKLPSAGVARIRRDYGNGLALSAKARRLSNRHKQQIADALQLNLIFYSGVAQIADGNYDFAF